MQKKSNNSKQDTVKKGFIQQSRAEAAELLRARKYEKSTIIVLIVSAIVFVGALIWIQSGPILHGEGDIFWVYGDERIDFSPAQVKAITMQDMRPDDQAEGKFAGTQELSVVISGGVYKGETMTVYNYFGPLYGVPVNVRTTSSLLA